MITSKIYRQDADELARNALDEHVYLIMPCMCILAIESMHVHAAQHSAQRYKPQNSHITVAKFQGLQNSGTDFLSDRSAYQSSVFTFHTSLVNGVPDSVKRNYVCFFFTCIYRIWVAVCKGLHK